MRALDNGEKPARLRAGLATGRNSLVKLTAGQNAVAGKASGPDAEAPGAARMQVTSLSNGRLQSSHARRAAQTSFFLQWAVVTADS